MPDQNGHFAMIIKKGNKRVIRKKKIIITKVKKNAE